MVPVLLTAIFLPGCTPACEGAGCADVYDRASLALVTLAGRPAVADPLAAPRWEAGAAQGRDLRLLAREDALWVGVPATGTVLRWDPGDDAPVAGGPQGDADARFGDALAASGADLLVGAPLGDGGGTLGAGVVEGWTQADGAWSRAWWTGGAARGDRFGARVAACGDLDGDGQDDVAIAAPDALREGVPTGALYLVLSTAGPRLGLVPTTTLRRVDARARGERLGAALLCDVDLTGDGRADLVLGVPGAAGGAGEVRVFAGGAAVGVEAPEVVLRGRAPEAWLGSALATGDLDGDGVLELVAGAPGTDGGATPPAAGDDAPGADIAGAVVAWSAPLVNGTPPAWTWRATHPRGRHGSALLVADLDGDGALDLAAGAPGHNPTDEETAVASGLVRVLAGPLPAGERTADAADMTVGAARQYLEAGAALAAWSRGGDALLVVPTREE
jgi:hypothetical protein